MSDYEPMNEQVRQTAKVEMTRRGYTQTQIAEALNLSRGHLNRMLSDNQEGTGEAKTPGSWSALLDVLGLKIVAVPKDFPVPEEPLVPDQDPTDQSE